MMTSCGENGVGIVMAMAKIVSVPLIAKSIVPLWRTLCELDTLLTFDRGDF
jgi:hypothetical protein